MPTRPIPAFLAANAGGMIVFLLSASRFWIEPEVADVPGANGGNAFGWIVFAAPIPFVFIVGSLMWTISRLRGADSANRLRSAAFMLAVLVAWTAVYLFDNAHHGV